jgi:medium-chain acyl-[acyl-carrier-protein] hydrolase
MVVVAIQFILLANFAIRRWFHLAAWPPGETNDLRGIMQPIWTSETTVKGYETDFRQCWKPASFFQSMQAAAGEHAEHLGVGFEAMFAQNMVWILSRAKIVFLDFPRLKERVIFETWPKGMQQKLFFMRDFSITAGDGRQLALASTAWLLVNPTARRMLMPSALKGELPDNHGRFALDEIIDRINPPDGMPERLATHASYSAVDMMGHVNNARYVEWISDCFTQEEYAARRLHWLQINYNNEIRPGERVQLNAAPKTGEEQTWLVQGVNQASGARAFEAAVGWQGYR